MKKRLPIGMDGFEKIRSNNFYFVDKTMFIAELLDNWYEVNLFTRPRSFGKSINMSMLKSFFEIGCDRSLFDGLKILKEEELCEKYMGKFPVISVSLKSIDGLNYPAACAALRNVIGKEALRFQFLMESNRLSEKEKQMYSQLIEIGKEKEAIFSMSDAELADSFHTLSQLLFKHYDRKIILLIDEYDVPLDKAFQAGYYNEMVTLIRNLFGNVLKSNEFLQFAVLTGCLRISKESIFTGLNNLKTYAITDSKCDEYFGFIDEEVFELLDYYGLSDHIDTIREWYDGYHFGKKSVYCPWDVLNYCDALLEDYEAEPENYWANTSGNYIVKRFIGKADRQTRSEMESLIAGKSIEKHINQELTYQDLDSSIENLWSVLFTTGYLTRVEGKQGKRYNLIIPNHEIQQLFIEQIREWFKEETRTNEDKLRSFCRAFPKGDAMTAEELLNSYLWKSISIRDTAVRKEKKEHFYHGLLLGLLQYESEWETSSNEESGEGYSDILIRTPDRIGVVIEIKYAEDGNLKRRCEEALLQIEQKKYDVALKRDGMDKIIKYGIACYKKNCKIMMK